MLHVADEIHGRRSSDIWACSTKQNDTKFNYHPGTLGPSQSVDEASQHSLKYFRLLEEAAAT